MDCVSHMRITQGLAEAMLQRFENEDAVIPGILRTGLFTIGAKDNIDKDARCTKDLKEIMRSLSRYHCLKAKGKRATLE